MKKGTFILAVSFLLSKILGLIRDHLLASQFGAGQGAGILNLDTYYAAFRVPDFLFNLLSYGVLSAAFVPIFAEILAKENRESANRFASQVLNAVGGIVFILSCILAIFAPSLVDLFLPGFSEENKEITITLTRLMLLTPVLFTASSVAGGVQNARNRYLGLALAPIFYNIGILGGIVFLSERHGVLGVAIGVALGAVLHFLVQLPSLYKTGFRYIWTKQLWSPRVKEMVTLSLPRVFGMSVTQLSLVTDTIIASTLMPGSIAVVNFASNLESLPMGLIGISIAIVSFGTLSTYRAQGQIHEFIQELRNNIRKILFLLIPIAAGMLILRFQIVRLILGRGKFNLENTILTANTLAFFLIGLVFASLIFLLARGFYAMKNTKTPVVIGIGAVLVNILFSILFTKIFHLETYGLALANSIANSINAILLLVFLARILGVSLLEKKEIGKFIIGSIVMVIAVQLTKIAFGFAFDDIDTYAELIPQTAAAILVGILTYGGVCWILKCKDIQELINKISSPIR